MCKITAALFFTFIPVFICQYQRDFFVFTAHLICDFKQFSYRIQYFEEDLFFHPDNMTRFDNIGLAKQGQAIANNFGVVYGDGFMNKNYEIYALITHNCTKNRKKMKQYKHDLETCSTEKSGCRKKFKLNITELGDEVNPESVENWLTKKSALNITELGDEVKPESIW
ncbi:hypothetical protein L3Y34_019086 [Caenorhabditis briggsae]|uniref:Uncharacterized protein n=1 Tax=Caenorhabditis briggsae TaxID=6238 RepID=A0AAE9DM12_CAEBR|nr:hypothetical protein L3Y34_019086 [Caenorhabditis briggsae]